MIIDIIRTVGQSYVSGRSAGRPCGVEARGRGRGLCAATLSRSPLPGHKGRPFSVLTTNIPYKYQPYTSLLT